MFRIRGGGRSTNPAVWSLAALALAAAVPASDARAQPTLDRSRDRGRGIPTSMFGTYVERGELLVYPFFEYYREPRSEYTPAQFGYGLEEDFRGDYRAGEGLLFLGYGISDRLAVEVEAAVITAVQEKSSDDPSAMPRRVRESGLGDVEGQLRWRWNRETERRPELFTYFETVLPLQRRRQLIGTASWEFKLGTGIVRGFAWGTATVRAAVDYDAGDGTAELGEYAVEYLERISPALRVFLAVEGGGSEVEGISEAQLFLRRNVFLELNNAVGLTPEATNWAPEVGLMISFR